jgi:hypothetical protein
MNISYDFVFPKAPCSILSVDTTDILGTHKSSLDKETTKIRLEAGTSRELGVQEEVINF